MCFKPKQCLAEYFFIINTYLRFVCGLVKVKGKICRAVAHIPELSTLVNDQPNTQFGNSLTVMMSSGTDWLGVVSEGKDGC